MKKAILTISAFLFMNLVMAQELTTGYVVQEVHSVKDMNTEEMEYLKNTNITIRFHNNIHTYESSVLDGIIKYRITNSNSNYYNIYYSQLQDDQKSRIEYCTKASIEDFISDEYTVSILDPTIKTISKLPCYKIKMESSTSKIIAYVTKSIKCKASALDILGQYNYGFFPILYTVYPKKSKGTITFKTSFIKQNIDNENYDLECQEFDLSTFKKINPGYTLLGLKE